MEYPELDLPEDKKPIWEDLKTFSRSYHKGEVDFKKYKSEEWKGYRFIPFFKPETAKRFFEDIEIEKNFILIASFPKTGTNWVYEITRHILYGDSDETLEYSKSFPSEMRMLSLWKPEKMDLLEHFPLPRKFFATHVPAELVNFEKLKRANGKIIVLVRNPKDQAVSWFHFARHKHFDATKCDFSTDWPEFLQDYVQGTHPMITKAGEWYPDFLAGWYEHKDDDNVLFVHYEDMKMNPKNEIRRISDFLKVRLTDDRVAAIAEATSFGAMKKEEEAGSSAVSLIHAQLKILRKGKVGTWKDMFTVAQSEMVDKIMEDKLGHTDIKFRYE